MFEFQVVIMFFLVFVFVPFVLFRTMKMILEYDRFSRELAPVPDDAARAWLSERRLRREGLFLLPDGPCDSWRPALTALIDAMPGAADDPDLPAHLDSCAACAAAVTRVYEADAAALAQLGAVLRKRPSERQAWRAPPLAEVGPCMNGLDALRAFFDMDAASREPDPDLLVHLQTCAACAATVDRVQGASEEAIRKFADTPATFPTARSTGDLLRDPPSFQGGFLSAVC